jgi:hypothetical protein
MVCKMMCKYTVTVPFCSHTAVVVRNNARYANNLKTILLLLVTLEILQTKSCVNADVYEVHKVQVCTLSSVLQNHLQVHSHFFLIISLTLSMKNVGHT